MRTALIACSVLAALTAGCSSGKSFGNLFGLKSGDSGKGTFYSGAEALKLYSKPQFSSSVIGNLSLHEKVYRSEIEKGFAHVKVLSNGQTGWVENAKLLWRLPSVEGGSPTASSVGAPADTAEEPVSAEAPAEEPVPSAPSAPPTSEGSKEPQGADPSLFNPY